MSSFSRLPRQWIKRSAIKRSANERSANEHSDNPSFRVMTFNLLASNLVDDAGFLGTTKDHLLWENRRTRLLNTILSEMPDILALQECDCYDDYWLPQLTKHGYSETLHVIKSNFKKSHGVTIFYNPNRFQLSQCYPLTDQVAALLIKLTDIKTQQDILILTTHLKAKKDKFMIRAHQLEIIKEQYHLKPQPSDPLIMLGDFNGLQDEIGIQKLQDDLKISPIISYPWTTWYQREPTSWQKGGVHQKAIDLVLTSPHFELLAHLDLPSEDQCQESGLLPGTRYPSDHLEICLDLHT